MSGHFDEDALARALLGGLDHLGHQAVADRRRAGRADEGRGAATGRAADARPGLLLDVGQAVVVQTEDRTGDLHADAVAGAQVLVDPDGHTHWTHARGSAP